MSAVSGPDTDPPSHDVISIEPGTAPPEARPAHPIARALIVPFRSKPVRTVLWFALIAAIPYLHPKLKRFRLFRADAEATVTADGPTGITAQYDDGLKLKESQNEKPPILEEDPQAVIPPPAPAGSTSSAVLPLSEEAKLVGAAFRPIEDPSGHAMDAFYASLATTDSGKAAAITRVAHYGDSLIVSDFMSSTLRRRFQARFGDAGHGFMLLAKPWAWYFHQDVSYWSSDGWRTNRIVNPRIQDELYGYGGASFRSADGGTKASFGTAKSIAGADPKNEKEAFGRRASRFQVHYLEQPDGGSFDVLVDTKKVQTISTKLPAGAAKKLAVATIDVDDGEHNFEVRVVGGAEVRAFGAILEREVPGVVWDALGVNGARARLLDVIDHAHWAESLRMRGPNMVILQYGTNESEDTGFPMDKYESTLEGVLKQVREALPEASCLVLSTMDRAGHGLGGMETRPIIVKLNEAQRKVAFKAGCAFWDTYLAMGGSGSMGRWYRANPRLGGGDLTHPTMAGATVLGDMLYSALMQGYESRPKK
jgi:lysophospholipase L1-like esterase